MQNRTIWHRPCREDNLTPRTIWHRGQFDTIINFIFLQLFGPEIWLEIYWLPLSILNCPTCHYGVKLSVVSNCPRCQIVRGVKLSSLPSWCQIVLLAIMVSNCPKCQMVLGVKLSAVSNGPRIVCFVQWILFMNVFGYPLYSCTLYS